MRSHVKVPAQCLTHSRSLIKGDDDDDGNDGGGGGRSFHLPSSKLQEPFVHELIQIL